MEGITLTGEQAQQFLSFLIQNNGGGKPDGQTVVNTPAVTEKATGGEDVLTAAQIEEKLKKDTAAKAEQDKLDNERAEAIANIKSIDLNQLSPIAKGTIELLMKQNKSPLEKWAEIEPRYLIDKIQSNRSAIKEQGYKLQESLDTQVDNVIKAFDNNSVDLSTLRTMSHIVGEQYKVFMRQDKINIPDYENMSGFDLYRAKADNMRDFVLKQRNKDKGAT
jgi:hypothetical protein